MSTAGIGAFLLMVVATLLVLTVAVAVVIGRVLELLEGLPS